MRGKKIAGACVLLSMLTSVICAYKQPNQRDEAGQDREPIQEQTLLVYRRYYFIARLEKTITLLARMYDDVQHMQDLMTQRLQPEAFTHPAIRHCVETIRMTRSLKPLFMVWDSFTCYKSLHDALFVEDFSKEIFLVTRSTLDTLHELSDYPAMRHQCMQCDCTRSSLESIIDAISCMTEHLHCLQSGKQDGPCGAYLRSSAMSDLQVAVHTDEVAHRFYCLHRLKKAVQIVQGMKPADRDRAERVLAARKQQYVSLDQAWDECMQYKYIADQQFVQQLTGDICYILSQHPDCAQKTDRLLSLQQLQMMQHQMHSLPLEEVFDLIDLFVKQVELAQDHYQASGLSAKDWVLRYWWVPVISVCTLAVRAFVHYYNHTYGAASR